MRQGFDRFRGARANDSRVLIVIDAQRSNKKGSIDQNARGRAAPSQAASAIAEANISPPVQVGESTSLVSFCLYPFTYSKYDLVLCGDRCNKTHTEEYNTHLCMSTGVYTKELE